MKQSKRTKSRYFKKKVKIFIKHRYIQDKIQDKTLNKIT